MGTPGFPRHGPGRRECGCMSRGEGTSGWGGLLAFKAKVRSPLLGTESPYIVVAAT